MNCSFKFLLLINSEVSKTPQVHGEYSTHQKKFTGPSIGISKKESEHITNTHTMEMGTWSHLVENTICQYRRALKVMLRAIHKHIVFIFFVFFPLHRWWIGPLKDLQFHYTLLHRFLQPGNCLWHLSKASSFKGKHIGPRRCLQSGRSWTRTLRWECRFPAS